MNTTTNLPYRGILEYGINQIAMINYLENFHNLPYSDASRLVLSAWEMHVTKLQADHPYEVTSREKAEAILNEALGFLAMVSKTGGAYSPSALVDLGWHSLMLDSYVYMALCHVLKGEYIHHIPARDGSNEASCGGGAPCNCNASCRNEGDYRPGEKFPALATTVQAMQEFGSVNMDLWPEVARCGSGNCSSCGGSAACRNN